MAVCNICIKRVLPHSYFLECKSCKCKVHIRCLRMVNRDDPLYLNRNENVWFCTKCSEDIFPFNHIYDDSDFMSALSESFIVENILPLEVILNQSRMFSPFELNESPHSPFLDADPDIQFYQNQCNNILHSCDYYVEDTLNNKLSKLPKDTENCLSILHLNIRSAVKNLDNFTTYLQGLDHTFPLIGFSETWFTSDNKDCYGIDGYIPEHNCRPIRTGGGVSIYIKENIEYTPRKDLFQNNKKIECVFIELDKEQFGKDKNIVVGVIYRPPDTDIKEFNKLISEVLSCLHTERKLVYLIGDFNINLLNADKHADTQDFADLMFSQSLIPHITKPTRVTSRSATLIDNIFTNNIVDNETVLTGLLYNDVSDHFPVFYIDYSSNYQRSSPSVQRRIYSENNISQFNSALRTRDWDDILSMNDAQQAYTHFHKVYTDLYNSCFPLKEIKSGYKTKKPWLSEGMKKQIKIKNRLYRRYKKTHNPEHEVLYKRFKNKLNGNLIRAEKEHYEKLFNANQNNLKKSWKILKEVLNKKKTSSSCSKFYINSQLSNDKNKIVDGFNNFFINIGPTLASNIPSDNRDPTIYMKNQVFNCMVLEPVLEEELQNVVMSMKDSSAGWDSISMHIVKNAFNTIKKPLGHIINISFSTGIFPLELKIARVLPLYKSGEASHFSNYRPVSVLPAISKVFEKLLYQRLLSFVNTHNILYAFQFGFRALHSPGIALIMLVDKISRALEEGDYVLGLFLDFSKAFDTVNHDILFKKLQYYGIQGTTLDLFKSYLSNRYQYVEYNGAASRKANIVCGVPQGSILGPLLFLIYINDLAHASSEIFSILFADDSNLFLSGKNPNELIQKMNTEIKHVFDWLQLNKLSINLKKTHYMIFRKRRQKVLVTQDLKINDVIINQVDNTKFLGVVIDPYLNFNDHIKYIKGKISRGLGILYRGRKFFNQKTMRTLYNVFIYPYLL